MANSTLSRMLDRLGGAGLDLWRGRMSVSTKQPAIDLCHRLLTLRGEASAIVIADEIISRFNAMPADEQLEFFIQLLEQFQPDPDALALAAERYLDEPGPEMAAELGRVAMPPRQEVIRNLSTSPSGVRALIKVRERLLECIKTEPSLKLLDDDFVRCFRSWFNRGFLELREIDWQTPAHILEKLIAYEAVHEIRGWDDLRRRLAEDRRCFAFFHPVLDDEPLVFVQVALTDDMAANISDILDAEPANRPDKPSTAVFYSISNCQAGLRGVSFGNFLIKQVLLELKLEFPSVEHSLTLSPVPNYRRWLQKLLADEERCAETGLLDDSQRENLRALDQAITANELEEIDRMLVLCQNQLLCLCAYFLLNQKRDTLPADAVARFHLSNGASLARINWAGDLSSRRLHQSFGILVNYVYVADKLETNHEMLVNEGVIAASATVKKLAQGKLTKKAA